MNKQLLSIISLIFSLALALAIYLYFDQIEDKNLRPITIVPDNYALILESNASRDHLKKAKSLDFMSKFMTHERLGKFMNELFYYDSLIKTNETINNWFNQGQAVYSFHRLPNNEIAFFMAAQTLREVNEAEVLQFFQTNFPGRYHFTNRKFLQDNVYDFTDFKTKLKFSIAFKSKLMLFSFQGNLVESALVKINKVNNEIPKDDKLSFVKNSGEGFNLHMNYANCAKLLNTVIPADSSIKFEILTHFAQRSIYNISMEDEGILLKGAAQTHETNFEFLDLLHAQAPIDNTLRNLLPEKIHFAYTLGFNGYQSFAKNVKEYLVNKGLNTSYQKYVDSLENAIKMPFIKQMKENLGNHVGIFMLDEPGLNKDSSYVIALEALNEKSLSDLLINMQAKFKLLDSLHITNDSVSSSFLQAPIAGVFKYFYTDLLSAYDIKYYTQKGKYFFFTNNVKTLQSLKNSWENEKLLSKNESYQSFEKKLSPNSNLEIYIHPSHAAKYALHFVNNEWFSLINQNLGLIKKVDHIGIQFAGSNDKIFATQVFAQFNVAKTEKTEQIWAIPLDSALISEPQILMNYSLGAQIILAQVRGNSLYAIDRDGVILWKKEIDGEIISTVKELDLFKNGKRQWLFNTARQIYVIQDDGTNCQGWPAWIPTGTKYPVSVFDPYEDKNYQIFASGQFYKITAFNGQGRPLTYWNPREVWPNLKSSIGNFFYKGSQVYWYLNEKGSIQFMDKEAKKNAQILLDSQYRFNQVTITSIDTTSFIISGIDSNNFFKIIYAASKKPSIVKRPLSGNMNFKTVYNSSYKPEFLFYNESQVLLQNEVGNSLFNKTLTNAKITKVEYLQLGESAKIVYQKKDNKTIHVIQMNGETYSPFPIQTTGKFAIGDLFNEGDNWLIFSDMAYQLNLYKIK